MLDVELAEIVEGDDRVEVDHHTGHQHCHHQLCVCMCVHVCVFTIHIQHLWMDQVEVYTCSFRLLYGL